MGVGEPQVAYRESITAPATIDYTHKKQSGGSGQFAKVQIVFEPIVPGEDNEVSDYEFVSEIKGGSVPKEYVPGVEKGIESILSSGVLACFPVTGVKARLLDGAYHDVDSSVMAFEIAGRQAARQGLREARSRLMEPVMKVEVVTPEEFMGTVVGDINSRRGIIDELGDRGNAKTVIAKVPLAQMFQYVSDLRSLTKGRAQYTMVFDEYVMVPPNVEKEICAKFKSNVKVEEDSAQDNNSEVVSSSTMVLLVGFVAGSGIMLIIFNALKRSQRVLREPLLTFS